MNFRVASLLGGLLAIAYMVGEIAVLVWLWQLIGWWVLGVMAATSLLGTLLVRREALKSWQQMRQSMATGALPAGDAGGKLFKFAGAILLILPGFIGNAVGLLLLPPFMRSGLQRLLGRRVNRMFGHAASATPSNVIKGDVVDDDVAEGTLLPPLDPPDRTD